MDRDVNRNIMTHFFQMRQQQNMLANTVVQQSPYHGAIMGPKIIMSDIHDPSSRKGKKDKKKRIKNKEKLTRFGKAMPTKASIGAPMHGNLLGVRLVLPKFIC